MNRKTTTSAPNTGTLLIHLPDWPQAGEIDLHLHDLPHKSSTTEWWYLHAHLQTADQRSFSLFVSFFRRALRFNKKTQEYDYAHSVIWALSDLDNKKYYTVSLVDPDTPRIGISQSKKEKNNDPFISKATVEMLRKGIVPLPDEMLSKTPSIPWHMLDLVYDDQTFKKLDDGGYALNLLHKGHDISMSLVFNPLTKAIRHGDNGVMYNSATEDMFYYFFPKCTVTGDVRIKQENLKIADGSGWYDHEFGAISKEKAKANKDIAWNWVAIQLDNNYQLTIYHFFAEGKSDNAWLILIDPDGKRMSTHDFTFDHDATSWTSTRTFNTYPTRWRVRSNAFKIDLQLVAAFEGQEFVTIISRPAFWEGRLDVSGSINRTAVRGKAYVERHGFIKTEKLPEFLKAVSKATLQSVKKIVPLHPDREKLEELVSSKGNHHFLKNLDHSIYIKKLITPLREITDRGGKSWRSYATIACCDVVGGNSQNNIDWLALPELLHVGSLMVDDVQDRSRIRRGGPSAHLLHGPGIAINSGTAAYFLGQICIYSSPESDAKKLQIYTWYFEAMRAAHSGQALDIYGLEYMMADALKDDKVARLLPGRVIAIHRLKSAAPASYLAKIGALLGDGSMDQINALGNFFEALGISFQIIDDTLNLKGFKDHLKTKAEDLTAGKITYPVALAISLMPRRDKMKLWNIVQSKTKSIPQLTKAIALMDRYGAIEESEKIARKSLETAWKKLDPLLENNMVKINLRAFSWFVLERTY